MLNYEKRLKEYTSLILLCNVMDYCQGFIPTVIFSVMSWIITQEYWIVLFVGLYHSPSTYIVVDYQDFTHFLLVINCNLISWIITQDSNFWGTAS